jgi:hypothetical protein
LDAQLEKFRDRFKVDSESEDTIPAIRKFKKRIERLNAWWGACAKTNKRQSTVPIPLRLLAVISGLNFT